MAKLHFTAHHNWSWVVEEALKEYVAHQAETPSLEVIRCHRARELPSQLSIAKHSKPEYALMRVETPTSQVWATSYAFTTIDAKDRLFQAVCNTPAVTCMPPTKLLPWDTSSEEQVPDFPTQPSLLKAACGSGGFGLYFVQSKADVVSVMSYHAQRACRDGGDFLEKVKSDYAGQVPHWSLQAVVPSIRVMDYRRPQIRAYVVYSHGHCYLYKALEVRVPSWGDQSIDTIISSPSSSGVSADVKDDFEIFDDECCANSNARPYNRGRIKKETQRLALDEVNELGSSSGAKEAVIDCMVRMMVALQPTIQSAAAAGDVADLNHCSGRNKIAVAGVDLMMAAASDSAAIPQVLEFNNNPAMPAPHKLMTEKYRASLIKLVRSIIELGLSQGAEHDDFIRCW